MEKRMNSGARGDEAEAGMELHDAAGQRDVVVALGAMANKMDLHDAAGQRRADDLGQGDVPEAGKNPFDTAGPDAKVPAESGAGGDEALIISGGSIEREFARGYMREHAGARVIAADAGLMFCRAEGILPDLIVGDFDSASGEVFDWYRERYPERIRRHPAKKDETDTELALREAVRGGCGSIAILGGTGTRLDHVLGNIQLLRQAMDADIPCVLLDSRNRIRMIRGGIRLRKAEQFGTYVSLIPFTETVYIRRLCGFAYNVSDFLLRQGMPVGVSNEIRDEEAEISLGEGIALLIESRD